MASMAISNTIISVIDSLGLIQGTVLGFLILLTNKTKSKATLFLCLFIFAYALGLLPGILHGSGITNHYPMLTYLPLDFNWLLFPLFFVYAQQISVFSNQKSYWVLYPGLVSLVLQLILFFFPISIQETAYQSIPYRVFMICGVFYSFWIGFKAVQWIDAHAWEVQDDISFDKKREMQWANSFLIVCILFSIFSNSVAAFFIENELLHVLISVMNIALLYWVSLRGTLQNLAPMFSADLGSTVNSHSRVSKSVRMGGDVAPKKELETIRKQVSDYLETTEDYTKNDLSIIDLANALQLHTHKISAAINSVAGQNFNSFVNAYRIEKAKKLLLDKAFESYSTEGIGHEAGFQSKSVFYAAFKKEVGQTPLTFKKEHGMY